MMQGRGSMSKSKAEKAEAKYDVTWDYPNLDLHASAAQGNVGSCHYALTHGQPVNSVLHGVLPLHAACSGGSESVVRMLLDRGADVNAPRLPRRYGDPRKVAPSVGYAGSTPLHFAAANGHAKIVKILLANGAVYDKKDKHGHTPEFLAREGKHEEVIETLRAWENLLEREREKEMQREEEEKKGLVDRMEGEVFNEDGRDMEPALPSTARWQKEWNKPDEGSAGGSQKAPRAHLKRSLDHIFHGRKKNHNLNQNTKPFPAGADQPGSPISPTASFNSMQIDSTPLDTSPTSPAIPNYVNFRRPSLPSVFDRVGHRLSSTSSIGRRTSIASMNEEMHPGMSHIRGRHPSRETIDGADAMSMTSRTSRRTIMSRHSLLNLFRRSNSRSSESPSPPRSIIKPLPAIDSGELEETIDRMREARQSMDGGSRPSSSVSRQIVQPNASDTEFFDALEDPDEDTDAAEDTATDERAPPRDKLVTAPAPTPRTDLIADRVAEPSRSYSRPGSMSQARPRIVIPSPPGSPNSRSRTRSLSNVSNRSDSGIGGINGLRPLSRLTIDTGQLSPLGPGRDVPEGSTVSRSYSSRSAWSPSSPRIPSQLAPRPDKPRSATVSQPGSVYDVSPNRSTVSFSGGPRPSRASVAPVTHTDNTSDQEAHRSEKEDHIGESIWDRAAARRSKGGRSRGASFTSIASALSSTPSSMQNVPTPPDSEEPPNSAGPSEEGNTSLDLDKRLGSYRIPKFALSGRPRNRSVSSTTSTSTSGNGFSSATYGTSFTPPSMMSAHLPPTVVKEQERDATPMSSAAGVARRLSKRREDAASKELLYEIPGVTESDSRRYETSRPPSISTKEEARDLVRKTEREILETLSTHSATGSSMSLAAQLAAYGEGLALEDSLPSFDQLSSMSKRPSPQKHESTDSTATITTSAESNKHSREADSETSSGARNKRADTVQVPAGEDSLVLPPLPTSIPSINRIYANRAAAYRDRGQALLKSAPKVNTGTRKGAAPPIAIENHWVMAGAAKPPRPASAEPAPGRPVRHTLQVPAPPLGGKRDSSVLPGSVPFSALDLAPPARRTKHRPASSIAWSEPSGDAKIGAHGTPHPRQPSIVFLDQTPSIATPKPKRASGLPGTLNVESRRSSEGKIDGAGSSVVHGKSKDKLSPPSRRVSADSGRPVITASKDGKVEVKEEKERNLHARSMSESVGPGSSGSNVGSASTAGGGPPAGGKSHKWGDISLKSAMGLWGGKQKDKP